VLAFLTGLGLYGIVKLLAARLSPPQGLSGSLRLYSVLRASSIAIAAAITMLALLNAAGDVLYWRIEMSKRTYHQRWFRHQVRNLPADKAIVFVRYAFNHDVHTSLINNGPIDRAKAWLVYDRGPENRRLIQMFPDRRPYVYDEARHTFTEFKPKS
jgi:hypothetical protein